MVSAPLHLNTCHPSRDAKSVILLINAQYYKKIFRTCLPESKFRRRCPLFKFGPEQDYPDLLPDLLPSCTAHWQHFRLIPFHRRKRIKRLFFLRYMNDVSNIAVSRQTRFRWSLILNAYEFKLMEPYPINISGGSLYFPRK